MKTFFQKHKILIISMAIVLCFGMFSGLVIGGAVRRLLRPAGCVVRRAGRRRRAYCR